MHRPALAIMAAVSLLTLASPALAVDLRVLSEDNNTLGLIDADAIETVGTTRRVKAIAVFPPRRGEAADIMVATVLLDCTASRYRIETLEVFDATMKLTGSQKPEAPTWEAAEEESPFTTSAGLACHGKPLPKASSNDIKTAATTYLARFQ
jgi:hypothetical protein